MAPDVQTAADEVAKPAADNRLPDLALAGYGREVMRGLARAAWERLRHGAPPGRARLSRPAPSGARPALGVAAGLALAALALIALGGVLAGLLGLMLGVLALGAFALALALDRVVPPPRRPFCQADSLPGADPGAHPLVPSFRETGLVEYVAGSLFVAQEPLVFYGAQLGARMAVARLEDGDLLIYSPISLTPERQAAVERLGRLRYLVAPNPIHHLFLAAWLEAFPDAEAWAGPGLAERRPDLRFAGVVAESEAPAPWLARGMRHAVIRGHPFHEELVMLHEPSRTLLVADMLENLGHRADLAARGGVLRSGLARFTLELMGMCERPGPPTDWKLTLEDRAAVAREAERVAGWAFERIVLAHGRLIDREAREVWRDAFAFAQEGSP